MTRSAGVGGRGRARPRVGGYWSRSTAWTAAVRRPSPPPWPSGCGSSGRPTLVIHVDDFHRIRAERHRLGRDSPLGFWLDTYDYAKLRHHVLEPLGQGGDGHYRSRAADLAADRYVDEPPRYAEPGTVVIVEGLFLHRDELVDHWDFSIFLDAPFEATVARMAGRDGGHPDPQHPSQRRYVEGQRLYFQACRPWTRADLVIDNADPLRPMISTAARSS